MNNERRHQLEQNELANRLGDGMQSVQSVLPLLLGGIAILAVGSIGWGLYSSSSKKKEAIAWTEYYFNLSSGEADAFLDVAEGFPTSIASGWARQTAGNGFLQRGIVALYQNRSEGEKLLGQAIEAFEDVESSAQSPELRAKALLGLAQAHESLGNMDEATSYYEQFTTTSSPPRQLNAANERLEFLSSDTGKNFYAWFNTLDPKPDSAIELPGDLTLPPTMQNNGLEFGPTDSTSSNPVTEENTPEIDTSSLPALPNMNADQPPASATPGELPPAVGIVPVPEKELDGTVSPDEKTAEDANSDGAGEPAAAGSTSDDF